MKGHVKQNLRGGGVEFFNPFTYYSPTVWPFARYRSEKAILERLDALEHQFKAHELDWDDIYLRCRKLMGRVVKERARVESAIGENGGGPDAQPVLPELPSGPTGRLSERQKKIQQEIMWRRAGGRP